MQPAWLSSPRPPGGCGNAGACELGPFPETGPVRGERVRAHCVDKDTEARSCKRVSREKLRQCAQERSQVSGRPLLPFLLVIE